MFPVIFSVDKFSVSTFGVFLCLAFFTSVFIIWRLSRAWDLNEEKILDLVILTIIGALIGARLYAIADNFVFFGADPLKWILFYKYPGFSFWGGFLGGWLALALYSKSSKTEFWLSADIASVGFLSGLIVADIGCFFGGCNIGIVSKLPFSVPMVGMLGNRFPVQVLESIIYLIIVMGLWYKATHFHKSGAVVSLALLLFGLVNITTSVLKASAGQNIIFELAVFILGFVIFYKVSGRNVFSDIKLSLRYTGRIFIDSSHRKLVVSDIKKACYNQKVLVEWRLRKIAKFFQKINVKVSHKTAEPN
jgi:prolipoprotein diacylglyceryltransferase